MKNTKTIALIAIVSLIFTACGGGSDDSQTVSDDSQTTSETTIAASTEESSLSGSTLIDGSSTVFPVTQAVAEEFTILNPNVDISVGVSGTGGGFKKFCPGETSISNASRPIKDKEKDLCAENGTEYLEIQVGLDALAVVVPKSNEWLTCLTFEELGLIWGADNAVSNWNQVRSDFPDEEINLFGPGTDSGTFDYFNEEITEELGGSRSDYTASEDDNVLVNGVSGSPGGLGYFGLAYFSENADTLNAVEVDGGDGCVSPLEALDGAEYGLARPLFIYVAKSAKDIPAVKEFVDFYFETMDILVQAVGYINMPADKKASSLTAWTAFSGS